MGDMKVGVANIDDKGFNGLMEDTTVKTVASSNPSLQVSVSFGRFENDDSLSWEKYSAFSPNKYLEEVGKFATPGSVAQKKAFFEAHYKKVAERKAEIMDQEKQMDKNTSFRSIVSDQGSMEGENGGLVMESRVDDGSNGQFSCDEDKHVTDVDAEVNEMSVDELNDEITVVEDCESSVDEAKEEVKESPIVEKSEIALAEEKSEVVVHVQEKSEEALQVDKEVIEVREEVREDNPSKDDTNETNETPMKEVKEERKRDLIKKNEGNAGINPTRSSPKPKQVTTKPGTNKTVTSRKTPPSKETRNIMKPTKKPAVSISKSPQGSFSTPRVYKPASQITSLSASQSSIKKVNRSALQRNKQTAPKSLHISMNLDTPASDPTALASTRKSLFMEQMGDKDIVKRAFRTFQKSSDFKTSVEGQNTALKHQNPTKATSIPSLATRPKPNDRQKASSMEKRSGTTTTYRPASHSLNSNETTEKQQKELSKSSPTPAKKTRLQKNQKTGVIDAKTRKDSLNSKAKPVKSSLPMRTIPKSSSDKEL